MKRPLALAAATLFSCAAFAQAPEVPKAKCEPKPVYPGPKAMQDAEKTEALQKQLKDYQECIRAYIAERRATIQANDTAMRAAAEEHNTVISKVRADQDAAKAAQDGEAKK
jgi:hypothetical protein